MSSTGQVLASAVRWIAMNPPHSNRNSRKNVSQLHSNFVYISLDLMRALWFIVVLSAAAHASAYDHFVSPDNKFEAYTTANFPDGGGMKLFLRRAYARDAGVLLAQNAR